MKAFESAPPMNPRKNSDKAIMHVNVIESSVS